MNTFQSTISSPRNQRILFWMALLALAAGVVVLVVKLVGGSDPTSVTPEKGFKPQLPAKTQPLTNADGVRVKSYAQLDPEIKEAIRGFVVPGVINGNYGASWKYTAPSLTHGATLTQWANATEHSVIPLPGYTLDGAQFSLYEATTKEVLVNVKLNPAKPSAGRAVDFRIGLVPYGKGDNQRWLVSYWMPTYQPLVPYGGGG